MSIRNLVGTLIGAVTLCFAILAAADDPVSTDGTETTGLYIIYDSSNSMWGELADGSRKYEAARQAMAEFLTSDFGDQVLALRVYGAQRAGDCEDSSLLVPFQTADTASLLIDKAILSSRPKGRTPIHLSLLHALEDFGDRSGRILLVSDGIESCGADPCALLREWREHNVSVDVYVVGFGLRAQERPALLCMAEASDTPFIEAASAGELVAALLAVNAAESTPEILESGKPDVTESYVRPVLRLQLTNFGGDSLSGAGYAMLVDEDGNQIEYSEILEVTTHSRNAIVPGEVKISGGVRTRNGGIYLPQTTTVTVAASGETTVALQVNEPARIRVVFRQDGEVLRSTGMVEALIEGAVVFDFRAQDMIYIDPGDYVFRTSPNDFNKGITVKITVPDSGIEDVVFYLGTTIRTTVRFFSSPWATRLSGAIHFFQNGDQVARVNATNAVRLPPGFYDYAMNERFATIEGQIEITDETGDTIDIQVPAARIVVIYETTAGERDADKRVFLTPASNNKRRTRQSGKTFYVVAGTYVLTGWRGKYEPYEFEVLGGEDLSLVLRAQE